MNATTCYIGLGSNLNDPYQQIVKAIELIGQLPDTNVIKQSSFYKNPPFGPIKDQDDFVNAAIEIETLLPAQKLMAALLDIEQKQGRVRAIKWGPRVLDCDILLYGDEVIDTPTVKAPHPHLAQRASVLVPLYEIAPDLSLPNGESIAMHYEQCNKDVMVKLSAMMDNIA